MVIVLLAMFLNENASRCANIRGVDQLDHKGELVMGLYRMSDVRRAICGKSTRMVADYQCHCGVIFTMRCDCEGKSKSCGCLRSETIKKMRTTHGACATKEYKTWCSMKARCSNENAVAYRDYGGRGISVCERWHTFANFVEDMGERPEGCSIDRIDVNGNYEPDNCRWATIKQQSRNKRSNHLLTIDGVAKTIIEWSECESAANYYTIRTRLRAGWPDGEAVFGRQATCKS